MRASSAPAHPPQMFLYSVGPCVPNHFGPKESGRANKVAQCVCAKVVLKDSFSEYGHR